MNSKQRKDLVKRRRVIDKSEVVVEFYITKDNFFALTKLCLITELHNEHCTK